MWVSSISLSLVLPLHDWMYAAATAVLKSGKKRRIPIENSQALELSVPYVCVVLVYIGATCHSIGCILEARAMCY